MSFYKKIAQIHNSGQSRSIVLCGNVYDLFWEDGKQDYLPLIPFVQEKSKGPIKLTFELNGPIRMKAEEKVKIRNAWISWKSGVDIGNLILQDVAKNKNDTEKWGKEFDANLNDSTGNSTCALEFMRQLSIVSRNQMKNDSIIFIIEAADMILPSGNGDIASLRDEQLHRISIVQDWISDPAFQAGSDTLILVAESRSLIHQRVSKLPQVLTVEVPYPDLDARKQALEKHGLTEDQDEIAELTASLSIYGIRQLMKMGKPERKDIIARVEENIQSQLGEDVVEFKKPTHGLNDCVGFTSLKKFLKEYLVPRFQAKGDDALPGAAVAGAIGGGKTFLFEAVAGELKMPVLVLKNIRSQWFGQTDVIFERLRRTLEALDRVLIFCDEADTMFGSVSSDSHETERRLTGKIQGMMSDTKLKGKVFWLLMTARIHLLSADIRRPGRVGDLIIPVLDPIESDRVEFIKWALKGIKINDYDCSELDAATGHAQEQGVDVKSIVIQVNEMLPNSYSAASFSSLKSNLKYRKKFDSEKDLYDEIKDFIQPAIGLTRRYQTLQALTNCTRLSLLPNKNTSEADREEWEKEIRKLEAMGVK